MIPLLSPSCRRHLHLHLQFFTSLHRVAPSHFIHSTPCYNCSYSYSYRATDDPSMPMRSSFSSYMYWYQLLSTKATAEARSSSSYANRSLSSMLFASPHSM
mmetsp:Transcript_7120/g.10384  ORF Transcript_7120/g.10384 Transcript_7120/m.10384 type:complete len:101 (-) Transcript_7120:48-350(-)